MLNNSKTHKTTTKFLVYLTYSAINSLSEDIQYIFLLQTGTLALKGRAPGSPGAPAGALSKIKKSS